MQVFIDKIAVSVVRTVTPWLVGLAVTLLAKVGLNWQPSPEVFILVAQGVSTVFYAAVRFAEVKGKAKFGWLLGWASSPSYGKVDASA